MPLISTSVLLGIADRAASQFNLINTAMQTINTTGGGFYYDRVTATNDPDVEIPLISTYYNSDQSFGASTIATTVVAQGMPFMTAILTQMDSHFSRQVNGTALQVGSWDGYLTDNDERVSDYFNQINFSAKTSFLLANNVFSENDDVFGTAEIIGGPAISYTDGVNYGNGDATNTANGTRFAATQLKVQVTSGGPLSADIDVDITGSDKDNLPITTAVTIPSGTPNGGEVAVGTTSDRYLNVTSVAFNGGTDGTLGDIFDIMNIKERTISF
jgi:hypothetical protein